MATDEDAQEEDKGRQTKKHSQADCVIDAFPVFCENESGEGVEKGADLLHDGCKKGCWGVKSPFACILWESEALVTDLVNLCAPFQLLQHAPAKIEGEI